MNRSAPLATDTRKVRIRSQTMLLVHHVTGPWPTCQNAQGAALRRPGVERRYTVTRWRPLSRRALRTRRPPLVFIRDRNPCTRLRRRTLGCQVRFGMFNPRRVNSQQIIIPTFAHPCKSGLRQENRSGLAAIRPPSPNHFWSKLCSSSFYIDPLACTFCCFAVQ
jgi:hypothetical protein